MKNAVKPITFEDIEKRANLLRDADKEKKVSLNPIDKNRNEHLERFWSAVQDFIGSIPQETLEFLRKLSEYDEENDEDIKQKVLVRKKDDERKGSTENEDLGPPSSKKRKKSGKSSSSKNSGKITCSDSDLPKLK